MMRRGNATNEVTALRRRFLLDLTYPDVSVLLADLFDLPPASVDVSEEEIKEARARMDRLGQDERGVALLGLAEDMAQVLRYIDDDDAAVWLVAYALASVNVLEDLGMVDV
jgi:hypothetical protein